MNASAMSAYPMPIAGGKVPQIVSEAATSSERVSHAAAASARLVCGIRDIRVVDESDE